MMKKIVINVVINDLVMKGITEICLIQNVEALLQGKRCSPQKEN